MIGCDRVHDEKRDSMQSEKKSLKELEDRFENAVRNLSPSQIERVQDFNDGLDDLPSRGIVHYARRCWQAFVSAK